MCERNIDQSPLTHSPTGDWLYFGYVPQQGMNQQTFSLQDDAQPTEPHWSGQPKQNFLKIKQESSVYYVLATGLGTFNTAGIEIDMAPTLKELTAQEVEAVLF